MCVCVYACMYIDRYTYRYMYTDRYIYISRKRGLSTESTARDKARCRRRRERAWVKD